MLCCNWSWMLTAARIGRGKGVSRNPYIFFSSFNSVDKENHNRQISAASPTEDCLIAASRLKGERRRRMLFYAYLLNYMEGSLRNRYDAMVTIEKLTIEFINLTEIFSSVIDRCLGYALGCNVKELCFKLGYIHIPDHAEGVIETIVAGCPLLEDLSVCYSRGFKSLKLFGLPKLNKVGVEDMSNLERLEMKAFNVQNVIFPVALRQTISPPFCGMRHFELITVVSPPSVAIKDIVDGLLWISPHAKTLAIKSLNRNRFCLEFEFSYKKEPIYEGEICECCKSVPISCWRQCIEKVEIKYTSYKQIKGYVFEGEEIWEMMDCLTGFTICR
ncbi:hypothetical protein Pint_28876 [Pistacia integerrima]|uniref:Uncharacterized protein n=1 Tax=Pistacia integerrima TaxID=434235 RepID=A0ACC0WYN1_9ROSI|nr:hypothetical protein Pint_28876 [Pistacia integerrima]